MCGDLGTTSRVCAMYSFTGILFTVSPPYENPSPNGTTSLASVVDESWGSCGGSRDVGGVLGQFRGILKLPWARC